MPFQCLLLSEGQVTLSLAVVIQTVEREPFGRKGTTPFRQDGRADVQNLAQIPCITVSGQKKNGPRPLPNQIVSFTTVVDLLKCDAFVIGRR